jgi:hypothetical protein
LKGREIDFHEGKINFKAKKALLESDPKLLFPNIPIIHFRALVTDIHLYTIEIEGQDMRMSIYYSWRLCGRSKNV